MQILLLENRTPKILRSKVFGQKKIQEKFYFPVFDAQVNTVGKQENLNNQNSVIMVCRPKLAKFKKNRLWTDDDDHIKDP